MPATIHERIQTERAAALPEAELVQRFRQYARGNHPGTLTAGQQRILRGLLGNKFSDNVCKRILQELRNRLRLARYDAAAPEAEQKRILDYLETVWTKNKLAALSASIHWAMFRDGNTAASLNWVGGRAVVRREQWWDGKSGIFVAYDDDGDATYAVREWKSGANVLRTVWFPDHIERYVQDGEGWKARRLATDPPEGPISWLDARKKPLGVPVVHFANVQVPNDGEGGDAKNSPDPAYGMSELDGGLLGLNDEVNDLHRDLSAGARFAGYQMLAATGVKKEIDEAGNVVPLIVEPGAMFTDESPDAKFYVLPPGPLSELERTLTIKLQAMSRAAGVPMHVIAGDWPSGEALMRAEMPLIDKVETVGASVGPAWGSLAHKCVKLSNAFGGTDFNEDALISAEFAPVARRDPMTLALVAEKLSKFVGPRETLKLLGYGPKDQERILKDLQANPLPDEKTEEGEAA